MEKGRFKNEEKHLSILLVPHSSHNTGVQKYTLSYRKLLVVLSSAFVFLVFLLVFSLHSISDGIRYRSTASKLADINMTQQDLLKERADEINSFNEREKVVNK